jgi:hypothetical protein
VLAVAQAKTLLFSSTLNNMFFFWSFIKSAHLHIPGGVSTVYTTM